MKSLVKLFTICDQRKFSWRNGLDHLLATNFSPLTMKFFVAISVLNFSDENFVTKGKNFVTKKQPAKERCCCDQNLQERRLRDGHVLKGSILHVGGRFWVESHG